MEEQSQRELVIMKWSQRTKMPRIVPLEALACFRTLDSQRNSKKICEKEGKDEKDIQEMVNHLFLTRLRLIYLLLSWFRHTLV